MTINRRLNNLYRTLHNEHGVGVLPKYGIFDVPPSIIESIGISDIYIVDGITVATNEKLGIVDQYIVDGASIDIDIREMARISQSLHLNRERIRNDLAPNLGFIERYEISGVDTQEYEIFNIRDTQQTTDGYYTNDIDPVASVFNPIHGRVFRFKLEGEVNLSGNFPDFGQVTVAVNYYYTTDDTTEIVYLVSYVYPRRNGLYVVTSPTTGEWIDLGSALSENEYTLPAGQSIKFAVHVDCIAGATAQFRNVRLSAVV